MIKYLKKKTQGFTLIELLIGLSIMGVAFGFGVAGLREFSRNQLVTGAARDLRSKLRLTQEQALAGKKPNHVNCNAFVLDAYSFAKVNDLSYEIKAICSGGTVVIESVVLNNGVEFQNDPPEIQFKSLGHGTNIAAASVDIILWHPDTGNTVSVVVSSTGDINDE